MVDAEPIAGIVVRASTAGDVAAITAIYADAVIHGTASFELEPPDETEMARRQQTLLASGYPYLVADAAGVVAGYAYAGPYRARPAYKWTVENSIYVAPQFQRRGIGLLLLTSDRRSRASRLSPDDRRDRRLRADTL